MIPGASFLSGSQVQSCPTFFMWRVVKTHLWKSKSRSELVSWVHAPGQSHGSGKMKEFWSGMINKLETWEGSCEESGLPAGDLNP